MSLLVFFIVLSALVIVHELGHFLLARAFSIRIDEFGLGYPPRAAKLFKWKETLFTLNWLPFGGFVKIFGEDPSEENLKARESFQSKNRGAQALVLAAGVFFNLLFAWLLLSLGLVVGLPAPQGIPLPVTNVETVITLVMPGSPAAEAGLKPGDTLLALNGAPVTPEEASEIIKQATKPLDFFLERGEETFHEYLVPASGVLSNQKAVGISMEAMGVVKLSPLSAVWEGVKLTLMLTVETAKALGRFALEAFVGRADLSQVTGPIGLVGLVGEASRSGWGELLAFVALISLNLSIINLLPFPALDGGRLLFVGIEAVTRRRIPARVFNVLNTAGFALLILLMILVTVHDVRKVF